MAIVATAVVVAGSQLCGPGAEAAPSSQANQTRKVDWFYWSNDTNNAIRRSRLDGSSVDVIANNTGGADSVAGLAVDPGVNFLYWARRTAYNQGIYRRGHDGSGSSTVLTTSNIVSPRDVVVDANYVYWTDVSPATIKRAATTSPYTVTTLADSTDNVSAPIRIAQDSTYVYWLDSSRDHIRRVAKASPHAITTLADSSDGISDPVDMKLSPDGNYLYWLDNGNDSIRRVATASPHAVNTVTSIVDGIAGVLALSPDGNFVYWSERKISSNAARVIRRIRTDGSQTDYETVFDNGNGNIHQFVLSSDSKRVYFIDGNDVGFFNVEGKKVGRNLSLAGNRNEHDRIIVTQQSETIDGSCITDGGSQSSDYASITWNADLTATCPRAFYTFDLTQDTDLRISSTSSAINPAPILRQGGIDGPVVAATTTASGASVPYVYEAAAGEYTVELARGTDSSQTTGGFAATVQTQPVLSGCDLNLGTLTSEPLTVFGASDPSCGDTRRYFFYLEYPAGVSVSANGQGFNPRIELRRSDATEASTPLAQNTSNPATLYSAVASGSYRINVETITTGDTYELSFQAFGLPPPTRTPIPTPTPRLQANVDVRLEPNPQGVQYERDQAYRFRLEGGESSFPAIIRLDNSADFALTTTNTLDCSAGSQLQDVGQLDVVYLHVCAAATNANISVIKQSDFSLLAQYPIYVPGEEIPIPDNVDGPTGYVAPPNDRIKLGVLVAAVCDGANVACNIDLVRNGVGVAGSLFLFVVPTRVRRGRASGYSVGIGMAAFILGLLLANALAGLPLWWAGIAFISVFALFGAGVYIKFRRFGS